MHRLMSLFIPLAAMTFGIGLGVWVGRSTAPLPRDSGFAPLLATIEQMQRKLDQLAHRQSNVEPPDDSLEAVIVNKLDEYFGRHVGLLAQPGLAQNRLCNEAKTKGGSSAEANETLKIQDKESIEAAQAFLDEAVERGEWNDADAEHFRALLRSVPDAHKYDLARRFAMLANSEQIIVRSRRGLY